jgi:hypothetical protein
MNFINITLIILSILISFIASGEEGIHLSPSNMRSSDCNELTRKICKSKNTGFCEAVYIAKDKADKRCLEKSYQNIINVCGTESAKLFSNDKECVGSLSNKNCPSDLKDLKQSHVENIAGCVHLHKALCKKVCGARYDNIDVRQFFQTGRKPGLLCQDVSIEEVKAGVKYSADSQRAQCQEIHQGNFTWCTNVENSWNGVVFGAFVQCQGRMR